MYSSRGVRSHTRWDPETISQSSIALQYCSDGYSYVGDRLIEDGIVEEVASFVEVGRHHGHIEISKNHNVYAVPYVTCIEDFVKPGDILFIRGGWKHWAPFMKKFQGQHWMVYYGAGTPRAHWPYWHAVLYDFLDKPRMGRYHPTIPFTKPIHPKIFHPVKSEKEYDILLNSCFHIYDKKGQYKVINAAVEYKKLYGEDLSIVMPGGTYRTANTNKIPEIIKQHNLNVTRPGTLSRPELNSLINKCRMYIHIGYGEQNARSALEAMCCNLPLYIASPHLWPKFVSNHPRVTRLCTQADDPKKTAQEIHQMLLDIQAKKFGKSTKHFMTCNNPETTVKQLTDLIKVMKENPIPNQDILRASFGI